MLNTKKITGQVDRQNAVPFLQRDVEDAALARMGNIIDENVQAAMFCLDVIEHRFYLFGIGHIGGETIAADLLGNFFGVRFMARLNHDLCAFAGERPCNSEADVVS